jgi:hypothetical protein
MDACNITLNAGFTVDGRDVSVDGTTLDNLKASVGNHTDVDLSSPALLDILQYNSSTGYWENQQLSNYFSSFAVTGETTITADSLGDTFTFTAGSGIELSSSGDTLTVSHELSKYIATRNSTGATSLGTTAVTLHNNFVIAESTGDFTVTSNEVDLVNAGTYDMEYNVALNNTTSEGRSTYDVWLEFDSGAGWADILGTRSTIYVRGSSTSAAGSASGRMIRTFPSGTDIRVRCERASGVQTSTFQVVNGSSLIIRDVKNP